MEQDANNTSNPNLIKENSIINDTKNQSSAIIDKKCKSNHELYNTQIEQNQYEQLISEQTQKIAKLKIEHTDLITTMKQEVLLERQKILENSELIGMASVAANNTFLDVQRTIEELKFNNSQMKTAVNRLQDECTYVIEQQLKQQEISRNIEHNQKYLEFRKENFHKYNKTQGKFLNKQKLQLLKMDKDKEELLKQFEAELAKNVELKEDLKNKALKKEELVNLLKIKQEKYDGIIKKYENDLLNYKLQIDSLKGSAEIATKRIEELEEKSEKLKQVLEQQDTSKQVIMDEVQELKEKYTEYTKVLPTLEAQIHEFNNKIETINCESTETINCLKENVAKLKSDVYEHESYKLKLEQCAEIEANKLQTMKDKQKQLTEQIKINENNLQDLKTNLNENATKSTEEIEECTREFNDLIMINKKLLQTKENLLSDLESKKEKLSILQSETALRLKNHDEKMNEYNLKLTELSDEIKKLTSQRKSIKSEITKKELDLKSEMSKLETEKKQKTSKINERTSEYKKKNDALKKQNIENYNKEYKLLQEEFQTLDLQRSELKVSITQLEAELSNVKQKADDESSTHSLPFSSRVPQKLPKQSKSSRAPNTNKTDIHAPSKVKKRVERDVWTSSTTDETFPEKSLLNSSSDSDNEWMPIAKRTKKAPK